MKIDKPVHTSAVVVALPSNARADEHCTIIYGGDGQIAAGILANYTARISRWAQPTVSRVVEHDAFGEANQTVRVARLDPAPLFPLFTMLQAFHVSQYGFKPHITEVGGTLRPVGDIVRFNRLAVWCGEFHQAWQLGTGAPMS